LSLKNDTKVILAIAIIAKKMTKLFYMTFYVVENYGISKKCGIFFEIKNPAEAG
jgi:hypothetical protein